MPRSEWRNFQRVINEHAEDTDLNGGSANASPAMPMNLKSAHRLLRPLSEKRSLPAGYDALISEDAEPLEERRFEPKLDIVLAPMSCLIFLFAEFGYNIVFLTQILPVVGSSVLRRAFCFLLFNVVLGMAIWSYVMAFFGDPGKLPERWFDFVQYAHDGLSVEEPQRHWQPGVATWCSTCRAVRPERAHHCDSCGFCVLRMDHHCPFIMNCVGVGNHKYFLLLLLYVILSCLIGFFASLPELWRFGGALWRLALSEGEPDLREFTMSGVSVSSATWLVLFNAVALIVMFMFSPMLLLCSHLALRNETHIENLYEGEGNPYDLGSPEKNMKQLMGMRGLNWLLPLPSTRALLEEGCSFPRNDLSQADDLDMLERLWTVRYDVLPNEHTGRVDGRDPNACNGGVTCFGPKNFFTVCRSVI